MKFSIGKCISVFFSQQSGWNLFPPPYFRYATVVYLGRSSIKVHAWFLVIINVINQIIYLLEKIGIIYLCHIPLQFNALKSSIKQFCLSWQLLNILTSVLMCAEIHIPPFLHRNISFLSKLLKLLTGNHSGFRRSYYHVEMV